MRTSDILNNSNRAESADLRASSRLFECAAGGPLVANPKDCFPQNAYDYHLPSLTLVDEHSGGNSLYAGNTFKDGPAAKDQRREQENV